jgi:hypothetical protein
VSFLSSAICTPKVTTGPSLFAFLLLHQTDYYYHTDFSSQYFYLTSELSLGWNKVILVAISYQDVFSS